MEPSREKEKDYPNMVQRFGLMAKEKKLRQGANSSPLLTKGKDRF